MRRIRVACINWGHPDAPHATCYIDDPTDGAVGITYHATWVLAMARATKLARLMAAT